jgi:hypothetical protein
VVANQKNEGQNVLQLAIRSRFKFIYRPAGLGNRDAAPEKLALSASGSSLSISNPTPFYLTVSRISRDGGKALNSKTVMLAPQSSQTVALSSVSRGETLTVNNINDYGADVAVKVPLNKGNDHEAEVNLPGKIKYSDRGRCSAFRHFPADRKARERYISLTMVLSSAVGKGRSVSLLASAITEGTYSLDVYTNNEWKGRYELNVTAIKTATWGLLHP